MIYYSIRVVKAESYTQALKKVEENDFDETDDLCDKVMNTEDLIEALKERSE